MGKRNKSRQNNSVTPQVMSKQTTPAPTTIQRSQNDLASCLGLGDGGVGLGGGINPLGFPGNQSAPWTQQISNVNTLWRNLRWFLISNDRQLLNEMYVELGLVQTVVDVPVDDALRGGFEIKSKQLSEEQVEELQNSVERDGDTNTCAMGLKWTRLFGGGGIIILTDQDPMEPLDLEAITSDEALEFRAVDMWELTWDLQNVEGFDPTTQSEEFQYYSYYGVKLHKSRVMQLKGIPAPSFIRPRLRGWGVSVCETLIRSINQYLKATDLTFEVLDEFKIDVYKIKNLVDSLGSPDAENAISRRMNIANMNKNYQNALVMDAEDEWDHKQISFSGLAETLAEIRRQVASDMRMPVEKLFGQSDKGGLGDNDQNALENYNSMVEGLRGKIKFDLLRILEIKCKKLFGFIPDDLAIEFPSLRVLSAEQEETVKTQIHTRLLSTFQAGLMSPEQFIDACNRADLFPIKMDTPDTDLLNPDTDDAAEEGKDGEDKVNKPDSFDSKVKDNNTKKEQEAPKRVASKPEEKAKIENYIAPYTGFEKTVRLINSAAFDQASYEADGGDEWIDERRALFFDREKAKNKTLWDKVAFSATNKDWRYIVWMYQKLGGTF